MISLLAIPFACLAVGVQNCGSSRDSNATQSFEVVDFLTIVNEIKACKTIAEVEALTKCPAGNYLSTKQAFWGPTNCGFIATHRWVNDKSILLIFAPGNRVRSVQVGEVYLFPFDLKK